VQRGGGNLSLLDQAKAAHNHRQSDAQTKRLTANNAVLKQKLKDILGIGVEPVGNRFVVDGLTLVVHHDSNLHVLYKCAKCGFEYRSFQAVRTLADLHIAATEPDRTHPCRVVVRQQTATLTPDQVVKA
jgi:hypothetical protein